MRRSIALVVLAACGRVDFDVLTDGGSGSGLRRRAITIENASTSPLGAGYSVAVDFSGVLDDPTVATARVLDLGAAPRTPGLDRVIDRETVAGSIWFALDSAIAPGGTGSYWLEYGDPTIEVPADATRVYRLADTFTSLAPRWQTLGTPVIVGNELVLGTGDVGITTLATSDGVSPATLFEARVAATAPAEAGAYYWIGYQHMGDFGTGGPFINWVGQNMGIHGWVQTTMNIPCSNVSIDTDFHLYQIARRDDRVVFYRDGISACDVSIIDTTDYSIQLRNQSPINTLRVEWVRVRDMVFPGPIVTLGPEE